MEHQTKNKLSNGQEINPTPLTRSEKSIFLIPIVAIVLAIGTCAFSIAIDGGQATVEQREGYYIFLMSKPVAKTEYLGTVKKGMAMTGEPEEMLNGIIKKVKKEYPKADAIVFTSIDMSKADAVKFKE